MEDKIIYALICLLYEESRENYAGVDDERLIENVCIATGISECRYYEIIGV